jgi:hypothetical protein
MIGVNHKLYAVYSAILEHVQSTSSCPRTERIAQVTGYSESTVRKYKRVLRTMNIIVRPANVNNSYWIYTMQDGLPVDPCWVALGGTTLAVYRQLVSMIDLHRCAPTTDQMAVALHMHRTAIQYHYEILTHMRLLRINYTGRHSYMEVLPLVLP